MTTNWEPETEELTKPSKPSKPLPFGKADWEALSIEDRAARAKESGHEGKLGSKLWDDLTPDEKASIIDPEKRPVRLDYQTKAHIVLEDSDKENWGMVKYLGPGYYTLKTVEGELVGNWSRSPVDGLIHVFLETPLQALIDKATQQFAEYAEMRKGKQQTVSAPRAGKARIPKVQTPTPGPSEEQLKINSLRKLLGR